MQPGKRVLVSATVLAVVFVLGMVVTDNWEVSQLIPPDSFCSHRGPYAPTPLGWGQELVTLAQAQALTSYDIPLPQGYTIREVWIEPTRFSPPQPTKRSVAILFESDLRLILKWEGIRPDYDRQVASHPGVRKIHIDGITGIGTRPGYTMREVLLGQVCTHPGSVHLWVDKLETHLYSDTLSLDELLSIARSMRPVGAAYAEPEPDMPEAHTTGDRDE